MLVVIVMMLLIVALAVGIGLYVAFPHRGEDVPRAPWLGDAMRKGVEALPTIDEDDEPVLQDLSLLGGPRTRK
jgi:hypothetical protein